MTQRLRIGPRFALPVDVAGEAIAILAKRGAGKTNTATVLVEELAGAGVQVVVLDPVGAWWGIRSSADGKGDGLTIPILGGQHGDVPLEPAAGALLADVVVDTGQSLLLDLSDFPSKAATARFVVDFGERLFRRKARDRSLVHLVLEEADSFAPQKGGADDARMRGAIEQIVRRGRSRGLGITMVTQRSAVLNKDVLSQADVLIAMRTTSPHDVKAIELWVDAHGTDEHGVVESLPSLETGEAWFWNPERGLLERVKVRRRATFDSSATPKAGERKLEPRQLAPIDLPALGAEIEATAERAKENDPKELRQRIRTVERERDEARTEMRALEMLRADDLEPVVEHVEVPVIEPEQIERFERALDSITELQLAFMSDLDQRLTTLREEVDGVRFELRRIAQNPSAAASATAPAAERTQAARRDSGNEALVAPAAGRDAGAGSSRPARPAADVDGDLPLGAAKLLTVLAQFPAGRTAKKLAVLAGYRAGGSSFRGAMAELRKRGYASPAGADPIVATPEGLAVAPAEPLPSGRELYEYWRGQLPEGARRVLDLLYERWPDGYGRDELAIAAGYEPGGSSFRGAVAALRNVDLATPAGVDPIRASDELMEDA